VSRDARSDLAVGESARIVLLEESVPRGFGRSAKPTYTHPLILVGSSESCRSHKQPDITEHVQIHTGTLLQHSVLFSAGDQLGCWNVTEGHGPFDTIT
jgi:hypothetical protein